MRFRLGFVTGLATGYYLGTRAGRHRYEQINRTIARVRRTEAYQSVVEEAKDAVGDVTEKVTEKAKAAVEEGVEKARHAISHDDGRDPTIAVSDPPPGAGYSSSR